MDAQYWELGLKVFSAAWPLVAIMLAGIAIGRRLEIDHQSVARLVIYFVTPIVVLQGISSSALSASTLLAPVLIFALCSALSFFSLLVVRSPSPERRLVALSAGSANCGYFGLPLVLHLLGTEAYAVTIAAIFGYVLYENTVGFYILARGSYTPKESIRRVLRLPGVWTFLLGILCQISAPGLLFHADIALWFRGAYTVMGMLLVGLALGRFSKWEWNFKFTIKTFSFKFLGWPLAVWALCFAFPIPKQLADCLLVLSTVPLAANSVAFATELRAHPQKMAGAVLLSTLASLLIIPVLLTMLL